MEIVVESAYNSIIYGQNKVLQRGVLTTESSCLQTITNYIGEYTIIMVS